MMSTNIYSLDQITDIKNNALGLLSQDLAALANVTEMYAMIASADNTTPNSKEAIFADASQILTFASSVMSKQAKQGHDAELLDKVAQFQLLAETLRTSFMADPDKAQRFQHVGAQLELIKLESDYQQERMQYKNALQANNLPEVLHYEAQLFLKTREMANNNPALAKRYAYFAKQQVRRVETAKMQAKQLAEITGQVFDAEKNMQQALTKQDFTAAINQAQQIEHYAEKAEKLLSPLLQYYRVLQQDTEGYINQFKPEEELSSTKNMLQQFEAHQLKSTPVPDTAKNLEANVFATPHQSRKVNKLGFFDKITLPQPENNVESLSPKLKGK